MPEQQEKTKVRAQKFSRLIKKGRNNTVKFRKYRATPTFRRLKRSLRQVKTEKKTKISEKPTTDKSNETSYETVNEPNKG